MKKLSDEELSRLYTEFYTRYIDEFKYFMVWRCNSMHADRYFIPHFKKYSKRFLRGLSKVSNILQIIS